MRLSVHLWYNTLNYLISKQKLVTSMNNESSSDALTGYDYRLLHRQITMTAEIIKTHYCELDGSFYAITAKEPLAIGDVVEIVGRHNGKLIVQKVTEKGTDYVF